MKLRLNKPASWLKLASAFSLTIGVISIASAKENIGVSPKPKDQHEKRALLGKSAGCEAATAQRDMEINNVRTTILNGGDYWWNLSNARYEIPKITPGTGQVSKHSLFSGALWIGGVTNGNLRIAAQTYRQSGNDFYPGPLTLVTASVSPTVCKDYDKIWKISLTEINRFAVDSGEIVNPDNATDDIRTWPAENPRATEGYARYLAPFFDFNGDATYNYEDGDYPSFDQNRNDNIPDQMLFWITNDKGNIHSESQGLPLGLEIHNTAFAYSTNDEVNNMTFYRSVIYNRSNETIDSTVFGQWVDPDLGNYNDDYVECDVPRNLGICYNGDDNDEGILGYGLNPPSVGVNFFEGPRRPDSSEIGLTKFVYYNNDFSNFGNPQRPEHYWGYLNGRWKDGIPITYGGNGRNGTDTASYMFPGATDPAGRALWTERTAQNPPADRRFLQTAGSFSLLPGAVNRVTIGVVWARASSGGATGSFNLLKQASDKAFILFKNNFKLIAGPDAPVLQITELDKNLIVKMVQTETIENFTDSFAGPCATRTVYKFQGYQIFQLKEASIPSDIYDQSQARLVAQFDIVDGVARLVNSIFSPELEENVKKIMVTGEDKGIQHSFQITKDLFETGSDQTLVNFKDYHYAILAYASATNCVNDPTQYLPGRKTIGLGALSVYTVTPHDPQARNGGTQVNSKYGDGLTVTQWEGVGNGGNSVELDAETMQRIINGPDYYVKNRTYVPGFGPVKVKVIDPLRIPEGDFTLIMRDSSGTGNKADSLNSRTTNWFLIYNGDTARSVFNISRPYEQLFPQWGISIDLSQSLMPGDANNLTDQSNGFISSSIEREIQSNTWLANVTDDDPNYINSPFFQNSFNWIRSGNAGSPGFTNVQTDDFHDNRVAVDPRKNFGKILDGTWSPYGLATRWRTKLSTVLPTFGPAWDFGTWASLGAGTYSAENPLSQLYSVNVVFTKDKSLWTRCIVLEAGENPAFNLGGADKMDIRKSPSVDKNGRRGDGVVTNDPNDADYISATGMSWFPGYAVNMETGERLNVLFAEDSSLPTENGQDMIWNPTSNLLDPNTGRPVFGGKHYVYVMGTREFVLGSGPGAFRFKGPRYDASAAYRVKLDPDPAITPAYAVRKRQVFSQAMWTSMTLTSVGFTLNSPEAGIVPSDVTIKIRVKRPYANFSVDGTTMNDSMPYFTFSTKGFAPTIGKEVAKRALDRVNIVPNPYYAYSSYESPGNQLDNQVRLVNLPARCIIRIYNLNGVLVRTIRKDDETSPYTIWDLKNDAQVPISSGAYLIHINATDLNEERIIKWFGVMRPVDFDTF
ncbi:MAG: hypothetical protein MUE96_02430 [Bacteroidia bacterium]|jgi:hypothetical protein|nr:hypothetical protein [Bacteroidia bacterium]